MLKSENKLLYIFTFIFGVITSLYLVKKGFFDVKIETKRIGSMSQIEEEKTKEIYEKMGYDTTEQKKKLEELKIKDLTRDNSYKYFADEK